jgi:hypothetical protein
MNKNEPIEKLDKAVQALKEAGYEFSVHKIVDTQVYGTYKDFSKRVIEVRCYKLFPVSENTEIDGMEKLTTFSGCQTC